MATDDAAIHHCALVDEQSPELWPPLGHHMLQYAVAHAVSVRVQPLLRKDLAQLAGHDQLAARVAWGKAEH